MATIRLGCDRVAWRGEGETQETDSGIVRVLLTNKALMEAAIALGQTPFTKLELSVNGSVIPAGKWRVWVKH